MRIWDLGKALHQMDEKIDHLLLRIHKNSCTISVFKNYDRLYQHIRELMLSGPFRLKREIAVHVALPNP